MVCLSRENQYLQNEIILLDNNTSRFVKKKSLNKFYI